LALVPKKTRIDWGVAMKMGVALDTQSIEVAKAELNSSVYNQPNFVLS
jgi:hypothetical protein